MLRVIAFALILGVLTAPSALAAAPESPEQVVAAYFVARRGAIEGVGDGSAALGRISPANVPTRLFVQQDLAALRQLVLLFDRVLTQHSEYTITSRSGLTLTVYEKVTVTWANPGPLASSPEVTSGVGYWHTLTLEAAPAGYRIARDAFRGLGWDSPDVVKTKAAVDPERGSGSIRGLARPISRPFATTFTYDRWAATNYAFTYWSSYNPAYYNFNGSGGDCTNFVSQSMNSGWQVMGPSSDSLGWWYSAGSAYPFSGQAWRYSVTHESWLINNSRAYHTTSPNDLHLGDVLYYKWNSTDPSSPNTDHTMIVTALDGNGKKYVTGHNPDLGSVPWDTWMASSLKPFVTHNLGLWDTYNTY